MSASSAIQSIVSVIAFLGAAFLSIVALTAFDSGVGPLFLVAILIAGGMAFMTKNQDNNDSAGLSTTIGGAVASGIFSVALVTGALSIVMWVYNSLSTPGDRTAEPDYSSMADIRCKDHVKDQLKAPSTAEFPVFPDRATKVSEKRYIIESHVDAQNSFGAKVRSGYRCEIELLGDYSGSKSSWGLISLKLAE